MSQSEGFSHRWEVQLMKKRDHYDGAGEGVISSTTIHRPDTPVEKCPHFCLSATGANTQEKRSFFFQRRA